jgi:hypothetical protein
VKTLASNEARVYFLLAGYNFDPEVLISQLGLTPTTLNRAGVHAGMDSPVVSSWEMSMDTLTGDDVDIFKMTNELVKLLEPAKDKIIQAIENYNLVPKVGVILTLSIDEDTQAPEFGFGTRAVRFLAELGAMIDIDTRQH